MMTSPRLRVSRLSFKANSLSCVPKAAKEHGCGHAC
jgi:hypothetical protein